MTLGNRILELRARSGLSQEDFGELFGATRQTVSRWELDLAIPEIQKIVQMARTFGVTTDSIISDGISTFDGAFKRFVCGIYRKKDLIIAETERLAITFCDRGETLCSELYEGMQENKSLRATAEIDPKTNKATYACLDGAGNVISNFEAEDIIGKKFDRKQLERMQRVETFLVDRDKKPLPTVPEAGFKTCLTSWRTGTKFYSRDDEIFACIYVGGFEYTFHMQVENQENIYCSICANEAYELGNCVGKQYFRLRNFGDNKSDFTVSFSHINDELKRVCLPSGEDGTDFEELCDCKGAYAGRERLEKVRRYGDGRITVSNCGDELTFSRDDPYMIERFEKCD